MARIACQFVFILLLATVPTEKLSAQAIRLRGSVFDAQSKLPLPFVNVVVNGGQAGTTSDIDGKFSLNVSGINLRSISFSYVGYQTFVYLINTPEDLKPLNNPLQIGLLEKASELEELVIRAGENPAHRIIRQAAQNRKANDPEKISS
ncbi:MAG: carboxypeptidase-like regulatory domain-containing protein, partial [Bacteroidia bacterium]|nr:carboxypeptidase-like regulatory domain-containing protein [Bacteroidia bacterium]